MGPAAPRPAPTLLPPCSHPANPSPLPPHVGPFSVFCNPGRLDSLLASILSELGARPSVETPTALALWAAALLNPLPALGVAPEIRPAVLIASSAENRLAAVERGIRRSLENLRGERPLR
jgi:hypothetical protein